MNTPYLIGITGKMRHGKDTVAAIAIERLGKGAIRIALADALKRETAQMLASSIMGAPLEQRLRFQGIDNTFELTSLIETEMNSNEIDPDTGLAIKERYRLLNQFWGTEWRRQIFGPEYWNRELLKNAQRKAFSEGARIVFVPDVRFPNEASFIKENGGTVWKVERPGVDYGSTHASEALVDQIEADAVIVNNGTLDDLRRRVGFLLDVLSEHSHK